MGDLVTNTLAVELMGRYSNLVLVQDGRIIDALKRVDFDDSEVRQLLPGLAYTLPPKPARPDFWRRAPPPSWPLRARGLACCTGARQNGGGRWPGRRAGGCLPRPGETPALACDLTAEEKAGWPRPSMH